MRYDKAYIDLIKEDKKKYSDDFLEFKKSVENSRAIYQGEIVPATYQGFFFDSKELDNFSKWTSMMVKIGGKIVNEYLSNENYRKHFNYDKDLENLILHYPGYDMPVVIGRYDIFYNGKEDFVFCEFNTDGSSAMNEEEEVSSRLLKTKGMRDFSERYNLELSGFELFYSLIDTLTSLYREIRGEKKPNVAILDFIDKGTSEEFEVFKEKFIEKGYNCEILDPRDLKYENGKLVKDGYVIDLVYRRAVTSDLMERKDEIKDFLKAYMDNAFVMFGSFRSQLMHSKLIFKILRIEDTKNILTDEENKFIEKHIPFTEELNEKKDYEEVINNKDKYILKPNDGYASHGVFVGRDFTDEEFEKKVRNIKEGTYIYQAYYDVTPTPFVVFDEDKNLKVLDYTHVLGLFIYGEKFSGMYSRIGRESIVSGAGDYFMSPNIIVKERK